MYVSNGWPNSVKERIVNIPNPKSQIPENAEPAAYGVCLPLYLDLDLDLDLDLATQPAGQQSSSQAVKQSISQSVNQSTSQPVNQSTSQPVNQSTSQPVNQSTSQPVNQSLTPSLPHSLTRNTKEGANPPPRKKRKKNNNDPLTLRLNQPAINQIYQSDKIQQKATKPPCQILGKGGGRRCCVRGMYVGTEKIPDRHLTFWPELLRSK